MARVRDIIQRDTRANQPLATEVDVGTLFYVTDESVTEYSNGTVWQTYADSGAAVNAFTIGVTVDGGGSVITTGQKGYKSSVVAGTIVSARLLADQSGSVVIDVWKDVFANYPPTNADSITAAAPPTITADDNSEDTTLTGWTTTVAIGDVFGFNVDSVSTIERVTLEIEISIP